jgi:hypothetical protein
MVLLVFGINVFFARYGFQNSFQYATNPMDAGENAILFLLHITALS